MATLVFSTIGTALGGPVGSAIDALIFLPLAAWAADIYGWRVAFEVAGVGGMILAAIFYFTVREPARPNGPVSKADRVPLREAIPTLWRSPAPTAWRAGISHTRPC